MDFRYFLFLLLWHISLTQVSCQNETTVSAPLNGTITTTILNTIASNNVPINTTISTLTSTVSNLTSTQSSTNTSIITPHFNSNSSVTTNSTGNSSIATIQIQSLLNSSTITPPFNSSVSTNVTEAASNSKSFTNVVTTIRSSSVVTTTVTTTRAPTTVISTTKAPKGFQQLLIIRFGNMLWNNDYSNPSSQAYFSAVSTIISQLIKSLQKYSVLKVTVFDLKQGSVIANTSVTFAQTVSLSDITLTITSTIPGSSVLSPTIGLPDWAVIIIAVACTLVVIGLVFVVTAIMCKRHRMQGYNRYNTEHNTQTIEMNDNWRYSQKNESYEE